MVSRNCEPAVQIGGLNRLSDKTHTFNDLPSNDHFSNWGRIQFRVAGVPNVEFGPVTTARF
jgi:hypothetical protein